MAPAGKEQIHFTVRVLSIAGFVGSVVWLNRVWVSGEPLNDRHFEPFLGIVGALGGLIGSFAGGTHTSAPGRKERWRSANVPSGVKTVADRVPGLWATGYCAAVLAVVAAYRTLEEPLKQMLWLRTAIASVPLALVFCGHAIPSIVDEWRRRRLKRISGDLKPGYFRLSPRDEADVFTRADNKHEEIVRWLNERRAPVLYLTGQSGCGKSSILSAWVVPRLSKQEPGVKVIQLRGYDDPLSVLTTTLREPGVIWKTPPADVDDARQLLERACRHLRVERLLIVFDQFEEFVILHAETQRLAFEALLRSLVEKPIHCLSVLLALRTDYIGILESLGMPHLVQETNWKEIPPFTEQAALRFIRASGLNIDEDLERDVLREAAEIEQTKGLIRPVTLNLCGLVLGRFATALPDRFRRGGMIRSFVRECMELPQIREITPKLIPALITNEVTKRPRTVTDLAEETKLDEATVRGCLRLLAQPDRGIVRTLDRTQDRWEISHDFLVPLLDSIFARWSVSLWRRTRPFLPWLAAATMALVAVAVSLRPKDPLEELTNLGWDVSMQEHGGIGFALRPQSDEPPRLRESANALRQLRHPHIDITLYGIKTIEGIEAFRDLRSLSSLNLSSNTDLTDLSPARELRSLSYLIVRNTQITDLSSVREMKTLQWLDCSYTKVADLEPLRELKRLTELDVKATRISDLEPLRELENLKKLDFSGTHVSDISVVPYLKRLFSLYLSDTQVSDLSPVRELKSLGWLDCSYTKVADLEPLRTLQNLGALKFSNTQVTSLEPLRNLKDLEILELSNTQVTSLEPLRNLKDLRMLDLSNNTQITDFSVLGELKSVSTLDLSRTKITDLEPLRELKGLTTLILRRTQLTDLSPLRELTNLSKLDLISSTVTDRQTLDVLWRRGVEIDGMD